MNQKLKEQMCDKLIESNNLSTITGLAKAFYAIAILEVGISVMLSGLNSSSH
jgi:hypothetical protein